jgi:hypothetical protein
MLRKGQHKNPSCSIVIFKNFAFKNAAIIRQICDRTKYYGGIKTVLGTGLTAAGRLSIRGLDLAVDSIATASKMFPAKKTLLTFKYVFKGSARNNSLSSSKPRVDTSRLPNTSSSLPSSSNSLAPASLKQGNGLASSALSTDEYVSLYRAVRPNEVIQIQNTSKLENIRGIERKYFSTTYEGAKQYAYMAEKGFGDLW